MGKISKKKELSEYKVNSLLTKKLKQQNVVVINRIRLNPAEFDLIIFDPLSLRLINIEIKRNKWERLFQQTQRGKLYCHYSIAMAPISSKGKINMESFIQEGIGLIFYKECRNDIELVFEIEPRKSESINRNFKKLLYEQVQSQYGSIMYA